MAAISTEAAAMLPPNMLAVENDEQAKKARVALKLYDEVAKRLKDSLHEYVKSHGAVEIADGVFYGLVEQSREAIDLSVPGAADAVREVAGLEAIEMSTSKAAIERSTMAAQEKRGEGAAKARALYDRLREMGAVRTSSFARTEEFTKKEIAA
jgi:hypothetical protein